MLHVRPAVPGDRPAILGFIDEASGWLALKGTDQWSRPWPNRRKRDGRVRRGIRDGCTWMLQDGDRPVATISCRPGGNPGLWDESELAEPAVYVSRLIVCRSHSGQDIGNELISWAGMWAAAQYGAQWIRIDVWTTNTMLHNYYEKRGFQFCRCCNYADYPSAMLFQKPTAGITPADLPRLREVPALQQPAGRSGQGLLPHARQMRGLAGQAAGLVRLHAAVAGLTAQLTRSALLHDRHGDDSDSPLP